MGIGFFAQLMGSINSVLNQLSTISDLMNAKEEEVEMWLVRLDRIYKEKVFINDYFVHVMRFFKGNWEHNFIAIKKQEFFRQLKPQLQNRLLDYIF